MKKFTYALIGFLLLALVALFFNYFLGEKFCGLCHNKPLSNTSKTEISENSKQKLTEFAITDSNGKILFKFPKGFIVNATDGNVKIPDAMLSFKDSIYEFLNKNQDKELLISAKYLKSEGTPVGLDRANFLKNVLVKAGINPHRIVPKAVLSDYNYDANSNYGEGIAMLFQNISEDEMKVIEESVSNKTLYSKFGSKEFKADATLKAYAFELKNYLVKYPEKQVSVTGHTDNVGNADANYNLGLKRAKFVVTYLISQGINENKIKALSEGETKPVADNKTEDGRAKNRRIIIIVE